MKRRGDAASTELVPVEQFKEFMFAQSQPLPFMMDFVRALKARHQLKVAVVSNEGG